MDRNGPNHIARRQLHENNVSSTALQRSRTIASSTGPTISKRSKGFCNGENLCGFIKKTLIFPSSFRFLLKAYPFFGRDMFIKFRAQSVSSVNSTQQVLMLSPAVHLLLDAGFPEPERGDVRLQAADFTNDCAGYQSRNQQITLEDQKPCQKKSHEIAEP